MEMSGFFSLFFLCNTDTEENRENSSPRAARTALYRSRIICSFVLVRQKVGEKRERKEKNKYTTNWEPYEIS